MNVCQSVVCSAKSGYLEHTHTRARARTHTHTHARTHAHTHKSQLNSCEADRQASINSHTTGTLFLNGRNSHANQKTQLQQSYLKHTQKRARRSCYLKKGHLYPSHAAKPVLGDSGGVVNSLDLCPASLKFLGCFYFRCVLSSQWKAVTVNLRI